MIKILDMFKIELYCLNAAITDLEDLILIIKMMIQPFSLLFVSKTRNGTSVFRNLTPNTNL